MVCYLATTKLIDIVTEMADVELIISSLKVKLYLIYDIMIQINHLFVCLQLHRRKERHLALLVVFNAATIWIFSLQRKFLNSGFKWC